MNIFLIVFCGVLMVLGVTELIRTLAFWLFDSRSGEKLTLVVAPEDGESCESLVRTAAQRISWMNLKGPCRLLCVNAENDPEIDSVCRFLALRYPYLKVSKTEELVYNILESEKTSD